MKSSEKIFVDLWLSLLCLVIMNILYPSAAFCGGEVPGGNQQQMIMMRPPSMYEGTSVSMPEVGPKSAWAESQKALAKDVLRKSDFDVLIVPFQVQGAAVDGIGRSLMTRYLAKKLVDSAQLRCPDPTLVARAFGTARTFNDDEIFALANDLKVKFLVRGYVGHNRNKKMNIMIAVQIRGKDGTLGSQTSALRLEWNDVPFTDEVPPSEAFLPIAGDIVSRLPIPAYRNGEEKLPVLKEIPSLPINLSELAKASENDPLASVYYLQLLGMLYPADHAFDETSARDHLFERSLVALQGISPNLPSYALLKARALFYLHRRPAATTALAAPKSPEEKVFVAYLNGNLSDMERFSADIAPPLHKLFAQIELNDLRVSYGNRPFSDELLAMIVGGSPEWASLITRRFKGRDDWYLQDNTVVKEMLDELFPLPDYTAEQILKKKTVMAITPGLDNEIDFAIFGHYKKLLTQSGQRYLNDGAVKPVARDGLDLLYAIGIANILKNIKMMLLTQGLNEQALEAINRLEFAYQGHVELTYLKVTALSNTAASKNAEIRETLNGQITELRRNVCHWAQGQTQASVRACVSPFPYYDDFPRRPYAHHLFLSGIEVMQQRFFRDPSAEVRGMKGGRPDWLLTEDKMVDAMTVWLLYSNNDFLSFQSLYVKLLDLKRTDESEALWSSNEHRFLGHPLRGAFIAKYRTNANGNPEQTLREAIRLNPGGWDPYLALGRLLLGRGDYETAAREMADYPPFREATFDDTVALSNYAAAAGNEFFRRGRLDAARKFFKLSSSYQTGSAAEFRSYQLLALFDGDYDGFAKSSLAAVKRYNDSVAHSFYVTSLYLTGHKEEADLLCSALDASQHSVTNWMSAVVGSRIAGLSTAETHAWLASRRTNTLEDLRAGSFLLNVHLLDREPTEELAKFPENAGLAMGGGRFQHVDRFLRGYAHLAHKRYAGAFDEFAAFRKQYLPKMHDFSLADYGYVIPYIVRSAAKLGRTVEAEEVLSAVQAARGHSFYVHIGNALLAANRGQHDYAIQNLKAARNNFPNIFSTAISPWYQLVEACEWLYDDTRRPEYRTLAVELARLHQQILPMYAWAYAVEAKFAETGTDRLRPLAIALYLDRQSARIADISSAEKDAAREWFKDNNPFLRKKTKITTF